MLKRHFVAIALCACSLGFVACKDSSSGGSSAGGPASDAAVKEAIKAECDKALQNIPTFIKDKNLDAAQRAVNYLEQYRSSLPSEYGAKIDQAKQLYESAKAAAGK